jgi:hypothetical protein
MLSLAALAVPARAATFSVGEPGDPGCTHATLASALLAAAATADGPHLIKLAFAEQLQPANAVVDLLTVSNPQADIELAGGYASCAADTPSAQESVFGLQPGGIGRVLRIDHAGDTRTITLRRLRLVNGNTTSFPAGVDRGGAVRVSGPVELVLRSSSVGDSEAVRGGGLAVLGGAQLVLEDGSQVYGNRAVSAFGSGAGIYCEGNLSQIWIRNGLVVGNHSEGNGGGLYLDRCAGLASLPNPIGGFTSVNIQNNTAGSLGVESRGFGGGIFSRDSAIRIQSSTVTTHAAWFLNNAAHHGGAIYTLGGEAGPVIVNLWNAALLGNAARGQGGALYSNGRADIVIAHDRSAPCTLGYFFDGATRQLNGCSLIVGNRSANGGSATTPGGAVAYLAAAPGLATLPRLEIQRSKLRYNQDSGLAALVYAQHAQVWIRNSILLDNQASGSAASLPSLLRLFDGGPHLLQHSTVLDNAVHRIAHVRESELHTTASVVWQPDSGSSQRLLELAAGGSLNHAGCLLYNALDATVPFETLEGGLETQGMVAHADGPRLDANYRPRASSRALDGCASSRIDAGLDFYGQPRGFDVPGVVNFTWHAQIADAYVNDLGAVEAVIGDDIFEHGFENPTL